MKVLWNKEDQKCGVWEPGAFCIKQSGQNEIGRAPSKPGRGEGAGGKDFSEDSHTPSPLKVT